VILLSALKQLAVVALEDLDQVVHRRSYNKGYQARILPLQAQEAYQSVQAVAVLDGVDRGTVRMARRQIMEGRALVELLVAEIQILTEMLALVVIKVVTLALQVCLVRPEQP
jgi:hypothetical protein|tara:strand:+ start:298 stop:633 length:336 start_codon:yes stop_codon:yes gene_type:complete